MDARLYSWLCAFCSGFMVVALGCADGAASFHRKDLLPTLGSQQHDPEQASAYISDDTSDDHTALVNATSPRQPPAPVLVRLGERDDLQTAIDSATGPVLLDFFADWCGPCKTQGKVLHSVEKVAAESGTLMIKINVDEHPELAKQLNVSSLPTLMLVRDGQVVERKSGLTNERQLTAWMR